MNVPNNGSVGNTWRAGEKERGRDSKRDSKRKRIEVLQSTKHNQVY